MLGHSPAAIRTDLAQAVAGLAEEDLRELNLTVTQDPTGDLPNQPAGTGKTHALVQGWPARPKNEVRRMSQTLARVATCTWPAGGWEQVPPPT